MSPNVMFVLVVALTYAAVVPIRAQLTFSSRYHKMASDACIDASDVTASYDVSAFTDCVRMCSGDPACASFSFGPSNKPNCRLSTNPTPRESYCPGTATHTTDEADETVPTSPPEAATTSEADNTSPPDAPTTPVSCTDGTIASGHYDCSGTRTYAAESFLRLRNNEVLVFDTAAQYYFCDNMGKLSDQLTQQCNGPYSVAGDSGLDSTGSRFAFGGPDAAVESLGASETDTFYYLFKGDTVYCYEHDPFKQTRMSPCTTGWTEMLVQDRFGAGIPSSLDDVLADRSVDHKYYFLAANLVYESTGNETVGALTPASPLPIHDVFPRSVCDVTAATLGANSDVLYAVASRLYVANTATVTDRNLLCNDL